jgi:TonB family protein
MQSFLECMQRAAPNKQLQTTIDDRFDRSKLSFSRQLRLLYTFGFELGAYDPGLTLIIDPTILVYAGYIGGSGQEIGLSIAVDSAGNVYVADAGNSLIRKITPAGTISTVAGVAAVGPPASGGDGGPALQAEMMSAMNIAFDRADNLYIVDSVGLRVRKVSADGTMSTVIGSSNPLQDTRRGVVRGGDGLAYLELYKYKPGGPITEPSPIYQTSIDYSDEARRLGIQGVVSVQALIRKDGTVQVLRLLHGLDRGIDETVRQAVQEWRFQPSILRMRNGPVDVLVNINVSFELQ